VLDGVVPVPEDVVDVDVLGVARVGHAVVGDEDDVDDVGEVARLEGDVEVFCEDVDLREGFLGNDCSRCVK
jgi:hypothetical protein